MLLLWHGGDRRNGDGGVGKPRRQGVCVYVGRSIFLTAINEFVLEVQIEHFS